MPTISESLASTCTLDFVRFGGHIKESVVSQILHNLPLKLAVAIISTRLTMDGQNDQIQALVHG
jgi:hypothetical protein